MKGFGTSVVGDVCISVFIESEENLSISSRLENVFVFSFLCGCCYLYLLSTGSTDPIGIRIRNTYPDPQTPLESGSETLIRIPRPHWNPDPKHLSGSTNPIGIRIRNTYPDPQTHWNVDPQHLPGSSWCVLCLLGVAALAVRLEAGAEDALFRLRHGGGPTQAPAQDIPLGLCIRIRNHFAIVRSGSEKRGPILQFLNFFTWK